MSGKTLQSILILSLVLLSAAPPARSADAPTRGGRHLRIAWSDQPPYQYQHRRGDIGYLTGADVVILREASERAGLTVSFRYMPFGESLSALERGEIDVVPGAYATPGRRDYAYVSAAYRTGRDRLFLKKDRMPSAPAPESPRALGEALAETGTVIAMVRGYDWGPEVSALLDPLRARGLLHITDTLPDAIAAALEGPAAGFLGDQLGSMALLSQWGERGFEMHPAILQERPIHLLLSRKSVAPWQRDRLHTALQDLEAEGQTDHILSRFVDPLSIDRVLGNQLVNGLFIVGIIAFSISGVVIARQGDYSIFGAFVLASLPALGGGVIRDLLLLREIYFFEAPGMIYACMFTILAGYLINRFLDRVRGRALWFFDLVVFLVRLRRRISPRLALEFFDAIGLALFTVVTVSIVAEEGLTPLWFWGPIIGAITATGGAVVRDMIRQEAHNPMLHTSFYGETAIIWGLALALFLQFAGPYASAAQIFSAVLVCTLGIFLTRVICVVFGFRSPKY